MRRLYDDFLTGSAILLGLCGVLYVVVSLVTGDSLVWGRFGSVIGFWPAFAAYLRLKEISQW